MVGNRYGLPSRRQLWGQRRNSFNPVHSLYSIKWVKLMNMRGFTTDEIVKWIITGISGIALTGGSFWLNDITSKLEAVENAANAKAEKLAQLEYANGEVARRLARIEDKLDRVIEHDHSTEGRNR